MFIVPLSLTRQPAVFGRDIHRLLDGAFNTGHETARSPALDVAETERGYNVKLEMPGVSKEDVQVSVEGRRVTVQASAKSAEDKKDGDRIVYRERSAASFARTFTLPVDIEQAESGAKLEHGVLELSLVKRAAATSKIAIN
jgi:HSP20 family protein